MQRTAVKRQPWTKDAATRRQTTLVQQRKARRDLTAHARRLAQHEDSLANHDRDEGTEPMDDIASVSKRRTREDRVKQRREYYSKQLMTPEWLLDVPKDLNGMGSALGEGWYVLPRPEGKRCLVVANGGNTIARIPSGNILNKFPSALPCGSYKTNKSSDGYCILDCIYQEQNETFYVLDIMCWKGYLLYNCTSEFRLYWMRDKLSEGLTATVSSANPFRFLPIPCYECDQAGIMAAYSTMYPFHKDGLLFYMKAGHYEMGLSPLALVWKDSMTSRFFSSTKPSIVLRLEQNNEFLTLEGIALFAADQQYIHQFELSEGDLASFSYDQYEDDDKQPPHLTGMTFVKRCSPLRALPDSWTKILFQLKTRSGGVTIEQILEVSQLQTTEIEMKA
ncbi:m3G-cap-specific nuclear import receptor (Snurportin1) [Plasmopara halstedii]|uniref:Snurportin-1 n=1 Tax=Plasmopara halstedii TaxID=4781 RepID=A0A0P1AJ51_PLAHL|nr:m3G-cap-specific nuclear import receptor (Snurportin1) [Plasmopara halstedii]CEG41386.1 m3G-cap-specific nuclear import receptor (Snurportin1) [Plasmopara halstedii]|eukprot:XP_024577755.1 m3G-cap-specific nuclear import receptor (Snurportin1) [Plasmopara halstedii]